MNEFWEGVFYSNAIMYFVMYFQNVGNKIVSFVNLSLITLAVVMVALNYIIQREKQKYGGKDE